MLCRYYYAFNILPPPSLFLFPETERLNCMRWAGIWKMVWETVWLLQLHMGVPSVSFGWDQPSKILCTVWLYLGTVLCSSKTLLSLSALLKGHNRRSPSARPQLEIYSSSGLPLASFPVRAHSCTSRAGRLITIRLSEIIRSQRLPFNWINVHSTKALSSYTWVVCDPVVFVAS